MENTKILHALDEFAKTKPKDIPCELEDYLRFVASCGDHVYQWSLVKCLFRQKLVNVISEFYESCPMMDVPVSPNVDAFNYEHLKSRLLQRYDKFAGAPFTIQRIAELLTAPRKQYNRVDKFMRAIEKNIWVVSTREPGGNREADTMDTTINVNGVPDSETKIGASPSERIKRQAELFDEEEDEEESEGNPPGLKATEIPTVVTETLEESPTSPKPQSTEISLETPEQQTANISDPDEMISNVQVSEIELITNVEDTSQEPVQQVDSVEDTLCGDDGTESKSAGDLLQAVNEADTSSDNAVSDVTDINDLEGSEVTAASYVCDGEQEDNRVIVNEPTEPESKTDLKRKFGDDEEELEVPCKRLDRENSDSEACQEEAPEDSKQEVKEEEEVKEDEEPVVVAAAGAAEVTEVTEELVEEVTEATVVGEAPEVKDVDEERKETEVVEEVGCESSLEVEEQGKERMESVESEEKVEMVVEEPEQAMEVDENSVQSPMECAVAEPMEESDVGLS